MQMIVQKEQAQKQKLVLECDEGLISRHVLSMVASSLLNIYTKSSALVVSNQIVWQHGLADSHITHKGLWLLSC